MSRPDNSRPMFPRDSLKSNRDEIYFEGCLFEHFMTLEAFVRMYNISVPLRKDKKYTKIDLCQAIKQWMDKYPAAARQAVNSMTVSNSSIDLVKDNDMKYVEDDFLTDSEKDPRDLLKQIGSILQSKKSIGFTGEQIADDVKQYDVLKKIQIGTLGLYTNVKALHNKVANDWESVVKTVKAMQLQVKTITDQTINQLKNELLTAQQNTKSSKISIDAINAQLEIANGDISNSLALLNKEKTEVAQITQDKVQLQNENTALKTQIQILNAASGEQSVSIQTLNKNLLDKSAELQTSYQTNATLVTEMAVMKSQNEVTTKEKQDLIQQTSKSNAEIETLKVQITILQNQITGMSTQDVVNDLSAKIIANDSQIAKLDLYKAQILTLLQATYNKNKELIEVRQLSQDKKIKSFKEQLFRLKKLYYLGTRENEKNTPMSRRVAKYIHSNLDLVNGEMKGDLKGLVETVNQEIKNLTDELSGYRDILQSDIDSKLGELLLTEIKTSKTSLDKFIILQTQTLELQNLFENIPQSEIKKSVEADETLSNEQRFIGLTPVQKTMIEDLLKTKDIPSISLDTPDFVLPIQFAYNYLKLKFPNILSWFTEDFMVQYLYLCQQTAGEIDPDIIRHYVKEALKSWMFIRENNTYELKTRVNKKRKFIEQIQVGNGGDADDSRSQSSQREEKQGENKMDDESHANQGESKMDDGDDGVDVSQSDSAQPTIVNDLKLTVDQEEYLRKMELGESKTLPAFDEAGNINQKSIVMLFDHFINVKDGVSGLSAELILSCLNFFNPDKVVPKKELYDVLDKWAKIRPGRLPSYLQRVWNERLNYYLYSIPNQTIWAELRNSVTGQLSGKKRARKAIVEN